MNRMAIWMLGVFPLLGLGCSASGDTSATGQALANQAGAAVSSTDGGIDVPRLCDDPGTPPGGRGGPPPEGGLPAGDHGAGCDADGGMPPGPRPDGGPPPGQGGPPGHPHPRLDPAQLCAAVAEQCPACPENPRCVDLVARCAAGTVGTDPDAPPAPAAP